MPQSGSRPAPPENEEHRMTQDSAPVVIKKYANRRLYDTGSSAYVTLEDLAGMVKQGRNFEVFDAKSGEDITRSVLAQIIFEQEAKDGQSLLPINVLRQLIGFYGDSLQSVVPSYLEFAMGRFSHDQQKFRDGMANSFAGQGFGSVEEIARTNMAMFTKAFAMFNPFAALPPSDRPPAPPEPAGDGDLKEMKRQLGDMQKRLDKIAGR